MFGKDNVEVKDNQNLPNYMAPTFSKIIKVVQNNKKDQQDHIITGGEFLRKNEDSEKPITPKPFKMPQTPENSNCKASLFTKRHKSAA